MSPDQINDFFSFLYEGRIGEAVFWVRLVAGVLTSAFAAAFIVLVMKYRALVLGAPSAPAEAAASEPEGAGIPPPWQEVLKKFESPNPSDWNLAVIQADAVFDGVLNGMGLEGETMGDRLKRLDRAKLASLDDVWEAHKTRNRIAHGTDQTLTYQEARRAVMLFGGALRELGYLQE